jgi:pimeloyl-ACP methyl ester carboxylesterase
VLLHGYGAGLIGAPTRVRKIVLLSPAGGFEPLSEEFYRRSVLTLATPTREVAADFLRWAAQEDVPGDAQMLERFERLIDQFHLGVRHFRREYFEAALPPGTFSDDELRATRVPTLLLIGDREPIYDSAAAVARARRLLPNVEAALVPRSSHMMCLSQARAVDARILAFLKW